ncbi:glycosyltransferase family 2 protein [Stagnihabitans tardus]|uniref:Glycosyltransferase n=1 Tax=Stagnihabitans tardus TaxID=2699202 RepID=A0AAE4YCD2_9RHOB|nr:glycosyltransferase [Stagnihabitans tardus]
MSAFNEGGLIRPSIESVLNQSFSDFELIIVDDGASVATTEAILDFKDDRIRVIKRSNDGLSSARNRGIDAARGDYICFLDADDIRPPWAFKSMSDACIGAPDCVFSPGILHELRNEALPFYDHAVFDQLTQLKSGTSYVGETSTGFSAALALLLCLEPQSANKMVRSEFVRKFCLKFPAGLVFEDIVFHVGVISNISTWSMTEVPTFTYFRRYGRPQITASSSKARFDALASCEIALSVFASSRNFQDPKLRKVALGSACKLLFWCRKCISLDLQEIFDIGLRDMFARLDRRYLWAASVPLDDGIRICSPWLDSSLDSAAVFLTDQASK